MRRKDKQLTKEDALDMLKQSKVISIGINTDKYPYVVPLNYACEIVNGEVKLYIHCAKEGRKIELLRQNPNVGFVVHSDTGFTYADETAKCSTIYKSVIGTGKVFFVEDNDKKISALSILMKELVGREVNQFPQQVVDKTMILEIKVNGFEGKASS